MVSRWSPFLGCWSLAYIRQLFAARLIIVADGRRLTPEVRISRIPGRKAPAAADIF